MVFAKKTETQSIENISLDIIANTITINAASLIEKKLKDFANLKEIKIDFSNSKFQNNSCITPLGTLFSSFANLCKINLSFCNCGINSEGLKEIVKFWIKNENLESLSLNLSKYQIFFEFKNLK